MKIGPLLEFRQQPDRRQKFVDDDVRLARAVEIQRGVRPVDREHVDGLHFDAVLRPVARILAEADAIVQAPRGEFVRAVGDHFPRSHPQSVLRGDGGRMHWEQRRGRAQANEKRRRIFQFDDQHVVIGRANPDSRKILERALVEGFCILDVVQLPGVFRGGRGFQAALPRCDKIRRGDRVAIGPGGIPAEVKRVGKAVGRHVPTFRDAGLDFPGFVVEDEALVERIGEPLLELAGHQMRVKSLGLGAVKDDEIRTASGGLVAGGQRGDRKDQAEAERREQEHGGRIARQGRIGSADVNRRGQDAAGAREILAAPRHSKRRARHGNGLKSSDLVERNSPAYTFEE